jgi:diacylglycerol kinase
LQENKNDIAMEIKKFFKSVKYAARGIIYVFKNEQNFKIQIAAAVCVIILMFVFELRTSEIIILLLLITSVLVLELLNSALEKFIDILKPRLSYQVEIVKDMMAAMVFITALGSAIIGVLIFWPHIFK